MESKVQKWGNSLAVRIPKPFAMEAGLDVNSVVVVSLEKGAVIIKPLPRSKQTLKQLLSKITEDNLHDEIETGPAVGNEVW